MAIVINEMEVVPAAPPPAAAAPPGDGQGGQAASQAEIAARAEEMARRHFERRERVRAH